ncbi:unnamed protein product, partial [Heterosigma akashiwo]
LHFFLFCSDSHFFMTATRSPAFHDSWASWLSTLIPLSPLAARSSVENKMMPGRAFLTSASRSWKKAVLSIPFKFFWVRLSSSCCLRTISNSTATLMASMTSTVLACCFLLSQPTED